MAKSRQIFRDMNILVDGIGNVGVSKSCELPKIEYLTIERDGAMAMEEVIPLIKAMSAKIVLNEYNPLAFVAASNLFGLGTLIIIKGSTVQDGKSIPVLATLGGSVKVIESPIPERGKEVEMTLEIAVTSYALVVNNIPQVAIDVKNMVCVIGGVDLYAELRAHIL
ncbi:MAG: phage major tail tube protein [Candidatus Paceibacterota bacterium]